MDVLEVHGKTVDEAIEHALQELGIEREKVQITILKEGKHGILGFGSEEALIRVEPLQSNSKNDLSLKAQRVVETLLDKIGIEASVTLKNSPLFDVDKTNQSRLTFDIKGEDLGILIGRRGQTLASLQHIVRLIMTHQTKNQQLIMLDIEGYRQRRYRALQKLAQRIADQVKSQKSPFTLEPMPAFERRIIHLALADHPDVVTESTGEGEARKVVIKLKKS